MDRPSEEARPTAPRRAVGIIRGDIPTIMPGARGAVPGANELETLVSVGLTVGQGRGQPFVPRVAEAVPSVENGLWRVFPDGRMETTWKLRRDVIWHDGTPLTAQDFVFKAQLEQDDRMPFVETVMYQFVESVEATDPYTLVMRWRRPYLQADKGFQENLPLPRHLLEAPYQSGEIERFLALAYWTEEFVGTGPYKVREWMRGSGVILDANDRYFLGRPQIDTIEIKFMVDPNTIAANILAGEVDVTFGGRLALDWATDLQARGGGRLSFGTSAANPLVLYVNLLNPNPSTILDVDFRRALVHSLDRRAMMDSLVDGLTAIADGVIVNPSRPEEFRAAESSIVKYDYDPRKAAQLIEGLGHRKGPDGFYRDPSGQRIGLEIRTTQGDIQQERSMFSTAAYWQEAGLSTDTVVVPSARRADFEYRFNFPAFDLRRQPLTFDQLHDKFHSSNFPLAENNWRGGNYGKYRNPELDRLVERHDVTIPARERTEIFNQIVRLVSDQVVIIGLFYDVEVTVISSRMKNVPVRNGGFGETWNAHEWQVTP
jgi:peptide/nickel transport system substrate-binding protein